MSAPGAASELRRLERLPAPLRRRAAAVAACIALLSAAVLFAAALWIPETALLGRGSVVPLLLALLLVGAAVATAFLWVRQDRALRLPLLGGEVERAVGLRAGEVAGALELSHPGRGESAALAGLQRDRVAAALAGRSEDDLLPASAPFWRRRARVAAGACALGVAAVALLAASKPERAGSSARALAAPWTIAFPPPAPPLRVEPGNVSVPRGEPVAVGIRAAERERVRLVWRVPGEVAEARWLPVNAATGMARGGTGPVEAPTHYWVEDEEGAASDTFSIRPLDPLLFLDLRVEAVYPAYLGRRGESFVRPFPALTLPRGTLLRLEGAANHPLSGAVLYAPRAGDAAGDAAGVGAGPGGQAGSGASDSAGSPAGMDLNVDGRRFSGEIRPRTSGAWTLRLATPDEALPEGGEVAASLELMLIEDSLPRVAIAYPGEDTVLGPGLRLPLIIDAHDDLGIRSVELVSRAIAGGESAAVIGADTGAAPASSGAREAVQLVHQIDSGDDPAGARRLVLRPVLEAGGRGLRPGDAVLYFARVRDGHPGHGAVSSDTFVARVPSDAERRGSTARSAGELAEAAGEAAAQAARLERRAEEAALRASAGGTRPPGSRSVHRAPGTQRADSQSGAGARAEGDSGERGSEFRSTEEGRRVLRDAEALREELAAERDRVRELRQALDGSPLSDPALRDQLARLDELYSEIMESGLGERIEELRRALRDLDSGELRGALERLSDELRRLRDRLDQTVALMERVALEQSLASATEHAADLAARQEEAASATGADSAWASEEERLAREVKDLAAELERLREELTAAGQDGPADSTARAGEDASAAAQEIEDAAAAASDSPRDSTGASGARSSAAGDSAYAAGDSAGAAADSAGVSGTEGSAVSGGAASSAPRSGRPLRQAQSAAGELRQAASRLRSAERELTRDWKAEAMAAVEQAAAEALQLAREQGELTGRFAGPDRLPLAALRGRQAALRRGLDNLLQTLAEAGRRTALLDSRTGPLAAEAANAMDAMLDRLTSDLAPAAPTVREGRAAVEALNDLAERLMASREAVEQASSATGMEEALERMSNISQAQGGMNRRAQALMLLQQGGRSVAAEIRRLAARQAEIARRLEELGAQPAADRLPGNPRALAAEAEEIAERLRDRGLDAETRRRQERLFRRLLDAGRSLEQDQRDPERRESETAVPAGEAPVIPELPPALRAGPRFAHPDAEALRGLPSAFRRMVYDYFDRLNQDPPDVIGVERPVDEVRSPDAGEGE